MAGHLDTASRRNSDAHSNNDRRRYRQNPERGSSTISWDMLPVHPIPCMQGPFEESIVESTELVVSPTEKPDAETRRRQLLGLDNDRGREDHYLQHTRWQQRPDAKFHPLWKLIAQISFGIHLLHKKLAKSDFEVVSLLQQHVDEVDGFIEDTTADFDLAIRDIDDRVRCLSLPFEHNRTFNKMLCDKHFRKAIIEGNDTIRHILDKTRDAMRISLEDIDRGCDATDEFTKFLERLGSSMSRDQQLLDVFVAMRGNAEGWRRCFKSLMNKAMRLEKLMSSLETIVDEIAKRAGIASRRKTPTGVLGRKSHREESAVKSPQSPAVVTVPISSGSSRDRDKPLPPEPSHKVMSSRSIRNNSTTSELSQTSVASSSATATTATTSAQSQPLSPHSSKSDHKRSTRSITLPKSSSQKGGLNVTFAADVKSPGPSTPNAEPPAIPPRRSRSQTRSENEVVEVALDHMVHTAMIDSSSEPPPTEEDRSEQHHTLPRDHAPPSSAFSSIGVDEEIRSKDLSERPASSAIDILFDGQERTPREEVALVLKGLGHDLYNANSPSTESSPDPSKPSSSTRDIWTPSTPLFSNPSPFTPYTPISPSNLQPSPQFKSSHSSNVDANGLSNMSPNLAASDGSYDDDSSQRSREIQGRKPTLSTIAESSEYNERVAIQSRPDSIPLDDIPLSMEAVEAIRSVEGNGGPQEVEIYQMQPKLVEMSPISEAPHSSIEYIVASHPLQSTTSSTPPDGGAAPDHMGSSSSSASTPSDHETSSSSKGLSSSSSILNRAMAPLRSNNSTVKSAEPASRVPLLGDKIRRLVTVYSGYQSPTAKSPSLGPGRKGSIIGKISSPIGIGESSLDPVFQAHDAPEGTMDLTQQGPRNSGFAGSHPLSLNSAAASFHTPKPSVDTVASDATTLDIWDGRDSIVKTPPGYVRKEWLMSQEMEPPITEEDGEQTQRGSFYVASSNNSSREGSIYSLEEEDEALIIAVTVPLPLSRSNSPTALSRVSSEPTDTDDVPIGLQVRRDVQLKSNHDSLSSTDTIRQSDIGHGKPVAYIADPEKSKANVAVAEVTSETAAVKSAKAQPKSPEQDFDDMASSMPHGHRIQSSFDQKEVDVSKDYLSDATDPSETIRVAVDMMPSFWPGQDRDSLLVDIGLFPGRSLNPRGPVELPETTERPTVPFELDQDEPSRNLEKRKLPKINTSMKPPAGSREMKATVVEKEGAMISGKKIALQSTRLSNSLLMELGRAASSRLPARPHSMDFSDDQLNHIAQPLVSAVPVKSSSIRSGNGSHLSIKTIRSESDLRTRALHDSGIGSLQAASQHKSSLDSTQSSSGEYNNLSALRQAGSSAGAGVVDPGLSESSSPTVGSPGGAGDEKTHRPSIFGATSRSSLTEPPTGAHHHHHTVMGQIHGSTTTLPSYFAEPSPNFAETLYVPRGTEIRAQMAGEEAEMSDETTALPSMLTHPELAAVKKRLSIRRPSLNNFKGLSQKGINPFLKKAFARKGSSLDGTILAA